MLSSPLHAPFPGGLLLLATLTKNRPEASHGGDQLIDGDGLILDLDLRLGRKGGDPKKEKGDLVHKGNDGGTAGGGLILRSTFEGMLLCLTEVFIGIIRLGLRGPGGPAITLLIGLDGVMDGGKLHWVETPPFFARDHVAFHSSGEYVRRMVFSVI